MLVLVSITSKVLEEWILFLPTTDFDLYWVCYDCLYLSLILLWLNFCSLICSKSSILIAASSYYQFNFAECLPTSQAFDPLFPKAWTLETSPTIFFLASLVYGYAASFHSLQSISHLGKSLLTFQISALASNLQAII